MPRTIYRYFGRVNCPPIHPIAALSRGNQFPAKHNNPESPVSAQDERVEEEAEWWEPEPVYKMHYQVTLEDGQQLAIFRNMKTGGWYRYEA